MPCGETRDTLTTPDPSPLGTTLAVGSIRAGDQLVRQGTSIVGSVQAVKRPVAVATAASLPANTKSGTTVLTADANGALTVDGVAMSASLRVLVKDEGDASKNGVYTVTDAGSAGTPWILTRAYDADTAQNLERGVIVAVRLGTNADRIYKLASTVATPHTTTQTWSEYGAGMAADTGWTAFGGTPDKASALDTATVSLGQLAERVKALQDALASGVRPNA